MKVKIDTKEKFDVITIEEDHISANMTEKLGEMLLSHLNADVKNLVIRFAAVKEIDEAEAVDDRQTRRLDTAATANH